MKFGNDLDWCLDYKIGFWIQACLGIQFVNVEGHLVDTGVTTF